jgi:hypothetical protein
MMVALAVFAAGAFASWLALVVFMIDMAIQGTKVPNRPPNVRWNPFNIAAYRNPWTPEIRRANDRAVRAGLCFLGFGLLFVLAILQR